MNALSPEQRERVDKALNPHDTVFSLRFPKSWIVTWRLAAKAEGKTLTQWVEELLNAAAAQKKEEP